MPELISPEANLSEWRWRRWRKFPWGLVVIVVVIAMVAPWLNPQVLAVVCAVVGGAVPVLVMQHRRVRQH